MPRLSYSQMRGMLQEPQLSQMTGLRVAHFLQTQCGWAATAEYDMTPPPAVPRLPMSSSMSMVPAWSLSGSGAMGPSRSSCAANSTFCCALRSAAALSPSAKPIATRAARPSLGPWP